MNIHNIINEEIKNLLDSLDESEQVMRFPELAEMLSRMGHDRNGLEQVFVKMFRKYGDEGVMNAFKSFSRGIPIKPVRPGQYVFDYSQQTVGQNNYGGQQPSYYNRPKTPVNNKAKTYSN